MKSIIRITLIILLITNHQTLITLNAQVAVNSDGTSPGASAILDVTSTSKGILIPRMDSTSRNNISNPAIGLMVFDSTTNSFWYYANSAWNNINRTFLEDSDGDTKIQVEESSDEDIIRFDLGGTEFMRLDSGRMEIVNTGRSIFIGDGAGENDDYSDNQNVFIGHNSGHSNTSGHSNAFVGLNSGYYNTTGSENIFLGYQSGFNNTTGSNNTFMSYRAGYNNTTGTENTFIGYKSGLGNTEGSYNVMLGHETGFSNTTGDKNVLIGYRAGYNENGSNKLYIENSNSSSPLIYGEFDNDLLRINGTLNINNAFSFPTVDGSFNQILATDGSGTLSWTDLSLSNLTDADGDTKIQVEESSDEDIIRFDLGGTEFLRLDSGRIKVANTGYSIFLGSNTGVNDDFTDNANVFIGNSAGRYNTSGYHNVGLGNHANQDNTTGYGNVALGYGAGFTNAGSENIFLGYRAGYNEAGSNKLYIENSNSSSPLIYGEFDNDLLQVNGTLNINNAFSFPTIDGNSNQVLSTDGSGTLSWTDLSLSNLTDADGNTKIQVEESSDEDIIRFDLGGTEFMRFDNGHIEIFNTGNSIFIGENAGENDDLNNRYNIAIGEKTLQPNSTGAYNVAVGHEAGRSLNNGYFNLLFGYTAGYAVTSGSNNVIIGNAAGSGINTGTNNVIIGSGAGGSSDVSDQLFIDNTQTDDPLIWGNFSTDELIFNGDVGIGTSPTKAKFEIDGDGSSQSFTSTHGVLNSGGSGTNSSNNLSLSIYASSNVAAKAYIAFSDARIKNIQGISNSKNDLNTLMDIQITDYTMKDTIEQGNQTIKKVIAQQVAEVYPQAVNNNLTDVIPNIYQRATIDENGWIELSTELKQGDKVQIYFDDKKELLEILEIKENAFRVATIRQGSVFVYGKQVNDFHTVDYEAISMLNVSATQQLAKENEDLKERMSNLEKENKALKVQLEKVNELEVMLQQLQAQLNNQNQ